MENQQVAASFGANLTSFTHTDVHAHVRVAAVLTPSAVTRLALSRCLSQALSRAWLLRQGNSLRSHTESHTPPLRLIERGGRRSGALRSGRGAMNISVSFGLRPSSWSEKVSERGNRRRMEYLPPGIKRQARKAANRHGLRERPRHPLRWSKVKRGNSDERPRTPLARRYKQTGSERH